MTLRDEWAQLLKRSPLKGREVPYRDAERIYPLTRRGSFCQIDMPAQGVLVASGAVYTPPAAGGIVRAVSWSSPGGAARQWRFGLRTAAFLAASGSGAVSNCGQTPIFPGLPLLGTVEHFGCVGIGDLFTALAQGRVEYPNLPVMPGNVFIVADTGDNFAGEGGIWIEEFLWGNEAL